MDQMKEKSGIRRIGGYLQQVVPIFDDAGKVVNYALKPIMVEFRPRDLMQVIVGASILAVPVALTEETWNLGERLPTANVMMLGGLSIVFIALFVFFNSYRFSFRGHILEYCKRVLATYIFSLLVVGALLTIIQKCPWGIDNVLAIKRILIAAFPASMSAAVSDALK